jgi:hypothetical protein
MNPEPRPLPPEPQKVEREDALLDPDTPNPETETIEDEGEPLGANFA